MKGSVRIIRATVILWMAAEGATAQIAPVTQLATVHPPIELRPTDTITGPLPASQPLHIVLTLRLRDYAGLAAFLATPDHPALTPAAFEAAYSPTPDQANAIVTFLRQAGFTNVGVSPNRLLVVGDAPAGVVSAAFHTAFAQVLTGQGREAFANTRSVQIPGSLQSTVLSVLGVQNVYEAHTLEQSAASPQPDFSPDGSTEGHDPTDFPLIYGASSLPAAVYVRVGIITEGSMVNVENDLRQFTTENGLPSVNVQVVGSGSSDTINDKEWDLDSQDIVAMGGVQNLILYDSGSLSESDLTTDYNMAASADLAKVVNVSLGECETTARTDGAAASDDQIFEEAEAQGQTFSVAAGDGGADECGNGGIVPSYPASSPYVVSVGGTELFTSGNTTWASETVWNDLASGGGATGGSPSTFEPQPAWQSGVGANGDSSYRGVADIAFDAAPSSGALVIVDGVQKEVGGTSLASPLFVGAWARILQADITAPGFAAPFIYSQAANDYGSDFHDVATGNNDGENAAPGWDYPTGFGSFLVGGVVGTVPGETSFTSYEILACNGSYYVTWSTASNATAYQIWADYPPYAGYSLLKTVGGTSTTLHAYNSTRPSEFQVRGCTATTCGSPSIPLELTYYSGCP